MEKKLREMLRIIETFCVCLYASVPMRGIESRSCSSCLKSDYSSMSHIKSLGDGGTFG